jgi:hypothetical protein
MGAMTEVLDRRMILLLNDKIDLTMEIILMIGYVMIWLTIWVQMFLVLSYFFSLVIAEYGDRLKCFFKWLACVIWYVYILPLNTFGFQGWQNWVYFCRYHKFISPDVMQWFCEPTVWLCFMFFWAFSCFFYEWSLKNRYDYFLVFLLWVIALIILTV